MDNVLAIILGGGKGTRLFPLTHTRAKPAVPIGGQYRLIDVPISNCLHAGLRRIFVLTQFNSASLNRHVFQSYRMDPFSGGFVEVLAAEQTPDNADWFQGTADAVRQAARHFVGYLADYYLILAGDHLYRMDYRALVAAHIERKADITIAAQAVSADDATGMGIFRFAGDGRIGAFEEKPNRERLAAIGASFPASTGGSTDADRDRPFMASLGIYVFSRQVLLDVLARHEGVDFGKEIIPAAIKSRQVHAYFHRGYWEDVGTIRSFYQANLRLTQPEPPFRFYEPGRPIFTHARYLPSAQIIDCRINQAIVTNGCVLDGADISQSVVGVRTLVGCGSRITRSILLGADYYEAEHSQRPGLGPGLGVGRDVVIDRAIVDKNARIGDGARLVNEAGIQDLDGEGYFIRGGIIVVPKGATIAPGRVV